MTWFIAAHPTLLAIGLLSVYTFLFSSGVISPICLLWSKFKARTSTSAFNSSRFAHNVYVPLMILSFISCLGLSAAFGAAVFLEQRTGSSQQKVDFFFCVRTFWSLMKYWERFPKFAPDVFTFCIMYCFACADVLVPVLVVLVTARHWPNENMKAPPQEITSVAPAQEPGSKNVHGFIVVAHNSSADIIHTIRAILKHVEPWQLFIADNGSSPEECVATKAVCIQATQEFIDQYPHYCGPPINISHLEKGNKTWAQYAVVCAMHNFKKRCPQYAGSVSSDSATTNSLSDDTYSCINTVTLLDDDVFWPLNWSQSRVNKILENKKVIAIAYPLRAENHSATMWTRFQEAEYLLGDGDRFLQDSLGTNLFCSGAAATWRVDALYNVLRRHDTTFHGEDLEMGYLTHKLSGQGKLLQGTDTAEFEVMRAKELNMGYKIALSKDCFVPTTVPYHFAHWWDFLPVPIAKKLSKRECCGESSLFNQRLRSWESGNKSFLFRFAEIAFSRGGWTSRAKWFARVMALWKVIGILREFAFVITILVVFLRKPGNGLFLVVITADMISVWWGLYLLAQTLVNLVCLRKAHLQIRVETLTWFPLLFLFVYMVFIRPVNAFYHVFYYLPFVRFPSQIRSVLAEDKDLEAQIDALWELESGYKKTSSSCASAEESSLFDSNRSISPPIRSA